MHSTSATLLVLQCTLCLSIRVPVAWNDNNSEVNDNKQFGVEIIQPQNLVNNNQNSSSTEYFEYTAQKPKFAVDIARYHGVQSPENHYKTYPVKPYTRVAKPNLGRHEMLNNEKKKFRPYQEYVKKNEAERFVTPSTTSYEVFHPYKLEEPALKELYQDPTMDKIRNDLINSKNRIQKYESDAGKSDITKGEYLESPEDTDRKKIPQRNVPVPYEIYRPQRRPVYYRPPLIQNHREHTLNQNLKHPWHQNYVKVRPMHYRPVKHHLQRLRQQHALKYDDEHNEYPQVLSAEKYTEPSDGEDIYERGKAKFVQLRNNVDDSINESVQKNRPVVNEKLELNNDDSDIDTNTEDEENEFIPIKNYAQVRRTDTTKYLPKEAAFYDADTLDEIINAPRLRQAVKSTKAQTVYSEEGYEDSAYDHAGEQKHASDHEGHGGFLKEKEQSKGKYKTPYFSAKYKDGEGSEYHDQVVDKKKWKDNKKNSEEETESEDYSEIEEDLSENIDIDSNKPVNIENTDIYMDNITNSHEEENERTKRKEIGDENSEVETLEGHAINTSEHEVNKREAKLLVPESKLNTTHHTEKGSTKLSKSILIPNVNKEAEKYPYYSKKLKTISKHSPLTYAENLKLIPKKSKGGTEFYDSKTKFECPEVDDNVDPIPEKLKKGGHPDEDEESEDDDIDEQKKSKSDFSVLEEKPRLRGLGDKIDCFKAKYFGENPLDSPFFEEEIISNPEPVTIPDIDIYKLKQAKSQKSKLNFIKLNVVEQLKPHDTIHGITDNVGHTHNTNLTKVNKMTPILPETDFVIGQQVEEANTDVNKVMATQPILLRKKRATPFVYEPYKIIRDSQIPDSKKTTTTNNVSPLIKQLQSSRVADRVSTNQGKELIVKRNAGTRAYKDIGKNDRGINSGKGSKQVYNTSFVDVSENQRRGEPRYELRPENHKNEYTPVENKKSMTKEDYKAQTDGNNNNEDQDSRNNAKKPNRKRRTTTPRPYFDVSKFLPHAEDLEKIKLSETKIDQRKDIKSISPQKKSFEDMQNRDDYDEYDDDKEDTEHLSTSSSTKLPPRRRIKTTTTTLKTEKDENERITEVPKLRLITRFRDSYQTEMPKVFSSTSKPERNIKDSDDEITEPKYREKKKKSSKSTLVTDTKSYGEDDDDDDEDLGKEEVDALIGIKQDIKEYMPLYEKKNRNNNTSTENPSETQDDDTSDDDYEEDDRDTEEDSDEYEDEENDEDNDEITDEDNDDENDETIEREEIKTEITTPEPTKRTLAKPTEAPLATTEARSAKLEIKPLVVKKKFEIHKELPVNRSSPHITEFKQDIKEVEIIKEIPSKAKKKPQKNIEALDLYKDENLAKEVNKLGAVEIFKEGLDLVNGPKHGGNYRSAKVHSDESTTMISTLSQKLAPSKGDVIASQSKTSKLIEAKDNSDASRRRNIQRSRSNRGRSAKLVELSDFTERPTSRTMHGGNFKSIHDERRRSGNRNAKIIELDEYDSKNDKSTNTHGGDFKSFGSRGGDRHPMHGGNYRSAKIVQAENIENKATPQSKNVDKIDKIKDGRRNAALFLSSFASAVPVLTTTPAYILDPSKRMYYYVDA